MIIRLSLFLYVICFNSFSQPLKVGADLWPGFTDSNGSGIYFELLKRIYPDKQFDFKLDSYNRIANSFQLGNIDIVVGVYREDIQSALLPHWFLDTEYPLVAFYDPQVTQINNISDIKSLKTSWKRGYHFEKFISDIENIYLVNNSDTGFDLLSKNRTDVFIDYPKNIPNKYLQQLSSIEVVPARHIYLAFQRNKIGQTLAKEFDKKMTELRQSGELATIFGSEYHRSDLANFNTNLNQIIIITQDLSLSNVSQNTSFKSTESLVMNLIQAQLPQFHIEFNVLHSLAQMDQKLKEGNVCFNNMLKTNEREKKYLLSKPAYFYMGLRFYSKINLQLSAPIDLASFLREHSQSKIGILPEQNDDKDVTQQLKQVGQNQIVSLPMNKRAAFDMFKGNHFDYMLAYPEEVASTWPIISDHELYSYELKNIEKYALGHVMCSQTDLGKKFIEAFNQAVDNNIENGMLFDIQYRSVPGDSQKAFSKYFKEAFEQ